MSERAGVDVVRADRRCVIFNADDFGYSSGFNRGIVEAHQRGVVTSASVMVTGHATEEAVVLAAENPDLSIGLHWDVFGEDERSFDLADIAAVGRELDRQLERFEGLFGRLPTHVDSHRHAHLDSRLRIAFRGLVKPLGVPVRGDGRVNFVGGFFAQPEPDVTRLELVSVPFLQKLLREQVGIGWTEIGCHPGYSGKAGSGYSREREEELRTLTDPRIRATIDGLGLRLVTYADYPGGRR